MVFCSCILCSTYSMLLVNESAILPSSALFLLLEALAAPCREELAARLITCRTSEVRGPV